MELSRLESDLPKLMAHLDIIDIGDTNMDEEIPDSNPRVLRIRKSLTVEADKPSNRRVNTPPRKICLTENVKQIQALYLNKTAKSMSQTLETIYEEPSTSYSSAEAFVGRKKMKNLLTFQVGSQYTREKIKKRRAKIKNLLGNKSYLNRQKIPMNVFLKSLECLDMDEVGHFENRMHGSVSI